MCSLSSTAAWAPGMTCARPTSGTRGSSPRPDRGTQGTRRWGHSYHHMWSRSFVTQEKCLILEAIRTVEERCHGKESCSVQASPETLASGLRDPCPTVRSADSQRNTVMIIMSFVGSMWRCCTSVSPCRSGLAWCAGENTCPCHAPHPPQGIRIRS